MDTTTVKNTAEAWLTFSDILKVLIGVFGTAIVAIITSFLTYRYTRKTRLEAEWRMDKLKQYRELLLALSHLMNYKNEADFKEATIAVAHSTNTLSLVAPQSITETHQKVLTAIGEMIGDKSSEAEEKAKDLTSQLVREIRKDLKITPADNRETFRFVLTRVNTNR